MNRAALSGSARGEQSILIQIGPPVSELNYLVRFSEPLKVRISVCSDRHSGDAHALAGPEHTGPDLSSVGDQ
jgi:hypothetical protein